MSVQLYQRRKAPTQMLLALSVFLLVGLGFGLYGAGVFSPRPKARIIEVEDPGKPEAPSTPKTNIPEAPASSPEKAPPKTPNASKSPTPANQPEPEPKPAGPSKKLAPTDPNFVPTEDPEPLYPKTPKKAPDGAPTQDPE